MDFKAQYQLYLDKINLEIEKEFNTDTLPQQSVFDAMKYGITAGGKRIRPVLLMAVSDLFGGNAEDAAKVALAVECVHNYSLIHDDLPCMDDDDLRRGRPTCHMVFEENIALLAGDGLLNRAFEILSDTGKFIELSTEKLIKIINILSTASGAYGMIGGQVIDLESENRTNVVLEELTNLHNRKTGDLIYASAVCGCICGGITDANDINYQKIVKFSRNLGLAFQIKDDILDVIGNQDVLGKPVGSDDKSNKNTFVTLMGLKNAEAELLRLTEDAKARIKDIEGSEFLVSLADYLLSREY